MPFNFQLQPGSQLNRRTGSGSPLISVISGYYNAGEYFEQTYISLLNQSFPWFEWIIVNDGSTNEADVHLLEELAKKDSRIRVVTQPNGGLSAARNRGVQEISTDIFVPLDTDDMLEPNALECLYWGLLCNPDAAWCYTDMVGFSSQQYVWRHPFDAETEKTNNLLVATAAIRKSAYLAAGGYREEKGHFYEDWHFWLTLLGKGAYPVHLQQYAFWYRRLPVSMLSDISRDEALKARADHLIAEAAAKVSTPPPAVQYPLTPEDPPQSPAGSPPQAFAILGGDYRVTHRDNSKNPVLILMASFEALPENCHTLQLVKQLVTAGHPVAVAALLPGNTPLYQDFFQLTPDCFYLPGFLRGQEQAAFVRWLVATRGIASLVVDNVPGGAFLAASACEQQPDLPLLALGRDKVTACLMEAQGFTGNQLVKPYEDAAAALAAIQHFAAGNAPAAPAPSLAADDRWLMADIHQKHALFVREYAGGFAADIACPTSLFPLFFDSGRRPPEGPPLISVALRATDARCPRTLQFLLAQTLTDYELLVLCDENLAATDPVTANFLRLLAEQESRVRLVPSPQPSSMAALKQLATVAQGQYLMSLPEGALPRAVLLETAYWGLALNEETDWGWLAGISLLDDCQPAAAPFVPQNLEQIVGSTGALVCKTEWLAELESNFAATLGAEGNKGLQLPADYLYLADTPLPSSASPQEKSPLLAYPQDNRVMSYAAPHKVEWKGRTFQPDKRIHLCMVAPWMVIGGAENFEINLLAGLDKNRFRVSILATEAIDHRWEYRYAAITPDVFRLAEFLPTKAIPAFISYFIEARQVDILLVTNSSLGYGLAPWLRLQFPALALCDYLHMESWSWKNGGFGRYSGLAGGIMEKTFVCNGSTRRVLTDYYGRHPETVETVYIGTDGNHYAPDKAPTGQLRRELGLDDQRPVILYACRMEAQKRPRLMMEIAKAVKAAGCPAAFVVVGDGPDLPAMKVFAAAAGLEDTVYFTGPKNDLRPYYRDADLLLICSAMEGLTLTTYEALAMETPVVTSDVGGQAELASDDYGAVLPASQQPPEVFTLAEYREDDIQPYVEAITRLLADRPQLEEKGHLARKRVLEAFTVDAMVAKMSAQLEGLMAGPAQSHRAITAAGLRPFGGMAVEQATLAMEITQYERLLPQTQQELEQQKQQNQLTESSLIYKSFRKAATLLDKLKGR